jgi:hypothetical protein
MGTVTRPQNATPLVLRQQADEKPSFERSSRAGPKSHAALDNQALSTTVQVNARSFWLRIEKVTIPQIECSLHGGWSRVFLPSSGFSEVFQTGWSFPRSLICVHGAVLPISALPDMTDGTYLPPYHAVTLLGSSSPHCLRSLCIPSSVKTLLHDCFSHCKFLSNVTFELGSRLSRMEKSAFSKCLSFCSICILRLLKGPVQSPLIGARVFRP